MINKDEFCIPILRDNGIIQKKEMTILTSFMFDYGIKPTRFILRNQSSNAIYNIKDLQNRYDIYLNKKYTKKNSIRNKIVKRILKELS